MKSIPEVYQQPCGQAGTVSTLVYRNKHALVYTPAAPAERILYLIHGGGGDQRSFFCPPFLNMVDHMMAEGALQPLYMVAPCFYNPAETDKTPASSGRAAARFCDEMRGELIPLAEGFIGRNFSREQRAISGFSMGGVTTWYAFLQALDLFAFFLPLSGDCWVCGEKGGGTQPEETARELAAAWRRQGAPDFFIHAVTGSADIAFPNLNAQIRAMERLPEFAVPRLRYDVLPGGVHDYDTIFRYLYNYLPSLF